MRSVSRVTHATALVVLIGTIYNQTLVNAALVGQSRGTRGVFFFFFFSCTPHNCGGVSLCGAIIPNHTVLNGEGQSDRHLEFDLACTSATEFNEYVQISG